MFAELRENKRLAECSRKAERLLAKSVPQPFILGVVKECGGKNRMREREWELARVDFVDAFKAYEEAGHSGKTIQVLKWVTCEHVRERVRASGRVRVRERMRERERMCMRMPSLPADQPRAPRLRPPLPSPPSLAMRTARHLAGTCCSRRC